MRLFFTLAAMFVLTAARAAAQIEVPWYTIDCGGGTSTNGTITISGTIGQHDAGVMSSGAIQVTGGFWAFGTPPSGCDHVDFNGDGLFPDVQDITDFLIVFSGGECPTGPGLCGDIDFNNDGLLPDILDIDSLLSVFAGGPCL